MRNARGSRKEIESGGAILLMSNVREQERNKKRRQNFSDKHKGKSKKEKGKGNKISLKSNWRMNEREQKKGR